MGDLAARDDEPSFRRWYATVARTHGLSPDPDDPQHFYDWRAAWRAGATADAERHWPSRFKQPGHPDLYVEGPQGIMDSRTSTPIEPEPTRRLPTFVTEAEARQPELLSRPIAGYYGQRRPQGANWRTVESDIRLGEVAGARPVMGDIVAVAAVRPVMGRLVRGRPRPLRQAATARTIPMTEWTGLDESTTADLLQPRVNLYGRLATPPAAADPWTDVRISQGGVPFRPARQQATPPAPPDVAIRAADLTPLPPGRSSYAQRFMPKPEETPGSVAVARKAPHTAPLGLADFLTSLVTVDEKTSFEAPSYAQRFTPKPGPVSLSVKGQSLVPFAGAVAVAADAYNVVRAARRVKAGKGTAADEAALNEFAARDAEAQQRGTTFLYDVANIATQIPAFATEFALTGGVYRAGRAVAQKAILAQSKAMVDDALHLISRQAAERALAGVTKGAGMVMGAAAHAAVQPQLVAGTVKAMAPSPKEIVGALKDWDDDFVPAFAKAFPNEFIEVFSERTGGVLAKPLAALAKLPVANKVAALKAVVADRWFAAHPRATVAQFFDQVKSSAAWHGILPEVFEERVAEAMRAPLPFLREAGEPQPAMIRLLMGQTTPQTLPGQDPRLQALGEFGRQLLVEATAFAVPGAIRRVAEHLAARDRPLARLADDDLFVAYQPAADHLISPSPPTPPPPAGAVTETPATALIALEQRLGPAKARFVRATVEKKGAEGAARFYAGSIQRGDAVGQYAQALIDEARTRVPDVTPSPLTQAAQRLAGQAQVVRQAAERGEEIPPAPADEMVPADPWDLVPATLVATHARYVTTGEAGARTALVDGLAEQKQALASMRQALQVQHGDTLTVYRVGRVGTEPVRVTLDPEVAKEVARVKQGRMRTYEVPVSAVRAVGSAADKELLVNPSALAFKEHEYSSTQVDLPAPVADLARAFAAKIPEADLADDGREPRPHVTVKYGLHTSDADAVRTVLADEPPIRLTLGATSFFPASEAGGGDVVKVDVDSADLRRLNAKIAGALKHTDTHPDYKPHVTLAYVKAGKGKAYAGDESLAGTEITLDRVVFAAKDGTQVEIPLTGTPSQQSDASVTAGYTVVSEPEPSNVVDIRHHDQRAKQIRDFEEGRVPTPPESPEQFAATEQQLRAVPPGAEPLTVEGIMDDEPVIERDPQEPDTRSRAPQVREDVATQIVAETPAEDVRAGKPWADSETVAAYEYLATERRTRNAAAEKRAKGTRAAIRRGEAQPEKFDLDKVWTVAEESAFLEGLYEATQEFPDYLKDGVTDDDLVAALGAITRVRANPEKAHTAYLDEHPALEKRVIRELGRRAGQSAFAFDEAPAGLTGAPAGRTVPTEARHAEAAAAGEGDIVPRGDGDRQLPERGAGAALPGRARGEGPLGAVPSEPRPPASGAGAAGVGERGAPGVVEEGVPRAPRAGEEPGSAPRGGRGASSGRALAPAGTAGDPGTRPADYDLTPERIAAIVGRGTVTRARDNVVAIQIAKTLQAAQRHATPAEQEALAKYVGWGASDIAAFLGDTPRYDWSANERQIWEDLRASTTETERAALAKSSPYAHFTYDLYRPIWAALERFGFRGGRVLEPAVGTGHAFGLMSSAIRAGSTLNGIELEPIAATIAQALYPSASIQAVGYEQARIPRGTQDLVIGNPPFGKFGVQDPLLPRFLTERIHNYFFAKALDHVRPGGLVAFITTHFTMDSADATRLRRYLTSKARFLGAVRLPNTAFDKSARTEVVTDVIVLQRLQEGETAGASAALFIEAPEHDALTQAAGAYDRYGKGRTIYRSRWYDEHPELILGREGATGTMRGAGEYSVEATAADIGVALDAALRQILPDGAYQPPTTEATARTAPQVAKGRFKTGELRVQSTKPITIMRVERDGTLVDATPQRVVDKATGKTAPDLGAAARIAGMVQVRDALRATVETMRNPVADDRDIRKAQAALKKAYDHFARKHGPLNARLNKGLFEADPESTNLLELERIEPKATLVTTPKGEKKLRVNYQVTGLADIFTKRTVQAPREITQVDSPTDALLASLGVQTRIDWPYMARISGKSIEELQRALVADGRVFEQPDGAWVTSDEYLSGDVVTKLQDADAATVQAPERYAANVAALRAVQPAPKTEADVEAGVVSITLGSHWVPPADLAAFVAAELPQMGAGGITARLDGAEAYVRWTVAVTQGAEDWGKRHPLAVPYGPKGPSGEQHMVYGFTDLLKDALNLQLPELGWWEGHGDNRHYIKDPEGTRAARANLDELRGRWMQWVFENKDALHRLLDNFNTRFNRTVKRRYDGSHLLNIDARGNRTAALPGLAIQYPLYPNQTNVIWRALTQGNTLAAHEVGAGKTLEGTVIAMEWRRTGRARKPMITVPTYLLGQWRQAIIGAYPTAKVLAFDDKDLASDKRQRAMARIAFGDWDIVLVPRSSFGLLKVSDQRMVDTMQRWVDELMDAEREARGGRSESRDQSVKALAAARARIEDKIARKMESLQKSRDDALTWEDLGVDALIIDEFHDYKNLYYFTKMENIRGLSRSEADRSLDVFVKIQDINEQSQERNVVLMTATPVMNSVAELFTMQRYLQPQRLRELGFENFDNWYQMFARALPTTEQRPDGTYQEVMRLREYQNLDLLYKTVSEVMDYVGWEDMPYLKLPAVKGGKVRVVETEPHPLYETIRQWFANRLDAIRAIPPRVEDRTGDYIAPERMHPLTGAGMGRPDNILTVMTDAKKAAIDVRLVLGTDAKDVPTSRLQVAARDIAELYKQETPKQGVVLVFLDMGTPETASLEPLEFMRGVTVEDQTDGGVLGVEEEIGEAETGMAVGADDPDGFNLYDALKASLVKHGVPAREIAYVHQARTSAERLALFQAANEGKVRVVLASTDKGGMGMNIQHRLAAVVHLDAPRMQRPGDIRQRDGRGIRQGNTYDEIDIVRYVTKGTTDEWLYGLLNQKSTLIRQFMRGETTKFTDDDPSTMSIEEAQIRATGDPRGVELTELRSALPRLQAMAMAGERRRAQARAQLAAAGRTRTYNEQRLADLDAWLPNHTPLKGDQFHIEVGSQTFTKRADAEQALERALKPLVPSSASRPAVMRIGRMGGMAITAARKRYGGKDPDDVSVFLDESPAGGDEHTTALRFDVPQGADPSLLGVSLVSRLVNEYESIPGRVATWQDTVRQSEDLIADAQKTLATTDPAGQKLADAEARIAALEAELKAEGKARDEAMQAERQQAQQATAEGQPAPRPRYPIREMRLAPRAARKAMATTRQLSDVIAIGGQAVAAQQVGPYFAVHRPGKAFQVTHRPTGARLATYGKIRTAVAVAERLTELGGEAWAEADRAALLKNLPAAVRDEGQRLQDEAVADTFAEERKQRATAPAATQPSGDGGTEAFGFVEPVSAGIALARRLWQARRTRLMAKTAPLVTSAIPEVEARIQAARGIVPPSIRQKATQALEALKGLTRHFPAIDPSRSPLEATVHELLLDYERAPKWAQAVAHNRIAAITDGLAPNQADLLTRALMLPDLLKDLDEGLYEGRRELPFGYQTRQQVEADLAPVNAAVAAQPAVQAALEQRARFVQQLTRELVDADLLPGSVLADARYYHRQVMAYVSAAERVPFVGATKGREVRHRTRGFQRARVGGGDFNTRYVEAEFEWVAQALTELKTKETLDTLKELADRTAPLKAIAKRANIEAVGAKLAREMGLDPVADGPTLSRQALSPFNQRIAVAIKGVLDALADGEYEVSPRFADIAVELGADYAAHVELQAELDPEDRTPFDANHPDWWGLLSDLVQHGGAAGASAGGVFKGIRAREDFLKETLGYDYIDRRDPDDLLTLAQEGYTTWQPKEGNHFFRAQSVDQRALEAVLAGTRQLSEADKRAVLAMGGPRETWIIQEWLAETLDHFGTKPGTPGPLGVMDRAWTVALGTWKQQMLLFPTRIIRYNLNNASGDSDAALAYAPDIFRRVPSAATFLYRALYGTRAAEGRAGVDRRMERLLELGVMDAGLTALEIPDVNTLPGFRRLAESDPQTFMAFVLSLGPKYYRFARGITQYRENILRVAAYDFLLAKIQRAGPRGLYAASNPARVDALARQATTDAGKERLAALLSRDLIGDYQAVSSFTQFMRTRTLPFFSFQEINFKRYLRLFGNIARDGGSAREQAGRAGRIGAVWAARTGAKWATRLALVNLFMVSVVLWNKLFFADEDEELRRRGRQQLHLIMGRYEDGAIRSVRIEGAFADFLEWIGLQHYIGTAEAMIDADQTIGETLADMAKAAPNKIVQLWEPFVKQLFEQAMKRKTFPDMFRPTPIRDRGEHLAGIAALDRIYARVTGKPVPPGNPMARLLFYRTDPGEAAYFDTRGQVGQWLERQGKARPMIEPTEKGTALYYWKRAVQWGDEAATDRWRARYYALGGTRKGMAQSVKLGAPLGALNRIDRMKFRRALDPDDRAMLNMAEAWYRRVYGRASTLPPRPASVQ